MQWNKVKSRQYKYFKELMVKNKYKLIYLFTSFSYSSTIHCYLPICTITFFILKHALMLS